VLLPLLIERMYPFLILNERWELEPSLGSFFSLRSYWSLVKLEVSCFFAVLCWRSSLSISFKGL
jgi:hypothetical protein